MKSSIHFGSVIRIIGRLTMIEALLMIVPMIVCFIYGEDDWKIFLLTALAAGAFGFGLDRAARNSSSTIRAREGFLVTSLIWIVFGLFGMIPLMAGSGVHLDFTDAFFEIISGFTTTGASVYLDVDSLSHGVLFWRAFAQWIGGLGIILFMLAVLPELNRSSGISMFNAESTGISHDKLHPRIRQTAISLWVVYAVITVVSILLLWAGPMNLFDSVCQTFAAIASGGFTTHNSGVMFWHSDYVLAVLTVVMFFSGVNFMVIYAAWKGDVRAFLGNTVVKTLFWTIVVAYVAMVLSAAFSASVFSTSELFLYPLFHVVSAISSTGFSVPTSEGWGEFALFLTIILMLCGACAGSTSGGMKIDRMIVLWKNLVNEIKTTAFPKRVYVVGLNGSWLQSSQVSRISAFVTLYMLVVLLTTGFITVFGYSFSDSLFMVSSCIGCNGLGYGATGVEGSYASLPGAVKWALTFAMLVGRLELFSFMVLFLPSFWRK